MARGPFKPAVVVALAAFAVAFQVRENMLQSCVPRREVQLRADPPGAPGIHGAGAARARGARPGHLSLVRLLIVSARTGAP